MEKHHVHVHETTTRERKLDRIVLFGAAALALTALAGNSARADIHVFNPLVGDAVALDHIDGTATNARFLNPTSIAVDGAGIVYVADGGDHTVRKVTAAGVVTTLAGRSGQGGSADGTGTDARFVYPFGITVDGSGNVYVTDIGNQNIRKITPQGVVTTLAGSAGIAGSVDGTGTAALFNLPQGIAVDGAGVVYVSDTFNSTIRRISTTGAVTTLAGAAGMTGAVDSAGSSARFSYPIGLSVDAAGAVYAADFGNSLIRKIGADGTVETLAGSAGLSGTADGQGRGARFDHPAGVAVDGAGNVYVVDTSNQTVRKITAAGSVTTLAGTAGSGGRADGAGAAARFFYPSGIAATSAGTVYVADTGNHMLRIVTPAGGVTTLAGATGVAGAVDGFGSQVRFAYPGGVSIDGAGALYIADHNNHTVRRMGAAGAVTTLAGVPGIAGSADGLGSIAKFSGPTGVAADGSGNVYVADAGNSTVRKIAANGQVTTFAGIAGITGSADGAGAIARFNGAQGIATDAAGNVYVADTNNQTIRKITAAGVVSTFAGEAGLAGSTDSPARFNGPYALAVDSAGNVYVADFFSATIRKITAAGTVSTLAGLAGQLGLTDGVGAAARFNQPYGVAVDGSGNVFVADTYNRSVRQISPAGAVTTLNGTSSRFFYPQGIAADGAGNLYIADGDNHAIAKGVFVVSPSSGAAVESATTIAGQNATFTLGVAGVLTSYQWQVSTDGGATWTSVSNNAIYSGATTATLSAKAGAALNGNLYRAQLANPAGTGVSGTATLTVVPSVAITGQPLGRTAVAGEAGVLTIAASGTGPSYQWYRGGRTVTGNATATTSALAFANVAPTNAGIYDCVVVGSGGENLLSRFVVFGVVPGAGARTAGAVTTKPEWQGIRNADGNVYDQFLLTGSAATITAAIGRIARVSFVDSHSSIVQVEMSGAGAVTVTLDNATGPEVATQYNQPSVAYMRGDATIILAGADESTHLSIYTVGRKTNPGVTRGDVAYDGWARVAVVGIVTTNNQLGGLHLGDVAFSAAVGPIGIYAPDAGTLAQQPVAVHDLKATAIAQPYLYFKPAGQIAIWIAGGTLAQPAGAFVTVSGLSKVSMGAGEDSNGTPAPAQVNQGRLVLDDETDVTSSLVVGP